MVAATRFTRIVSSTFIACLMLVFSVTASSGDFFEPGGLAIRGYDPVAYFTEKKAVQGTESFSALYKGSQFRFASAANRAAFTANPERYAPQYGGFCAYAAALGNKAPIDPNVFTIVDNKLYLNFNRPTEILWSKDIQGYISKADKNWPDVQRKPNPKDS